jgi:hypothetical protein
VALMTKCIYRFNKRVYDKQFFYWIKEIHDS